MLPARLLAAVIGKTTLVPLAALGALIGFMSGCAMRPATSGPSNNFTVSAIQDSIRTEKQVTREPRGHLLTNIGAWSPDGEWIVYDTRSDASGEKFDGATIEMVNVRTGEVRELYRSGNGAFCGVATFHPREFKVAFIHGPEHPTDDWRYGPAHRQGVIVETARPGVAIPIDARDLTPPFTPGALRGGSHVHVWNPTGDMVSFTYEDHILPPSVPAGQGGDINQRNIGVSVAGKHVTVPQSHPRNHDGTFFTVLVTRTVANPRPGSDEIAKAFEECWVGTDGYLRADGSRQRRAIAFQGHTISPSGRTNAEVFIVDLPESLAIEGDGPLAGTASRRPFPPRGVVQRRLTFTSERKFPGIQGPRHWLRASPDGASIAFLMRDDAGVVQLWIVSPNGGEPRQITRNAVDIASAFTWSPDGSRIAHVLDGSVCVSEVASGRTIRLTAKVTGESGPRPEACVFSLDGRSIAYVRRTTGDGGVFNQIFTVLAD